MAKVKSEKKIKRRRVNFTLDLSDAKEVILMGNFNDWNPKKHPMQKDENGVWNKTVILPPGYYEYKFLVDNQWKEDPQNDQICQNRFGTYNNVINLTIP